MKIYLTNSLLTMVTRGGLITTASQLYVRMHPKEKYTEVGRDGTEYNTPMHDGTEWAEASTMLRTWIQEVSRSNLGRVFNYSDYKFLYLLHILASVRPHNLPSFFTSQSSLHIIIYFLL